MSDKSRLQRTTQWLRDRHFHYCPIQFRKDPDAAGIYQKVEYWNSWAGKSIDLYGIGDILVTQVTPTPNTLLIQVTGDDLEAHLTKYENEPTMLQVWLLATNRFQIHTWKKKSKGRWNKDPIIMNAGLTKSGAVCFFEHAKSEA